MNRLPLQIDAVMRDFMAEVGRDPAPGPAADGGPGSPGLPEEFLGYLLFSEHVADAHATRRIALLLAEALEYLVMRLVRQEETEGRAKAVRERQSRKAAKAAAGEAPAKPRGRPRKADNGAAPAAEDAGPGLPFAEAAPAARES